MWCLRHEGGLFSAVCNIFRPAVGGAPPTGLQDGGHRRSAVERAPEIHQGGAFTPIIGRPKTPMSLPGGLGTTQQSLPDTVERLPCPQRTGYHTTVPARHSAACALPVDADSCRLAAGYVMSANTSEDVGREGVYGFA